MEAPPSAPSETTVQPAAQPAVAPRWTADQKADLDTILSAVEFMSQELSTLRESQDKLATMLEQLASLEEKLAQRAAPPEPFAPHDDLLADLAALDSSRETAAEGTS